MSLVEPRLPHVEAVADLPVLWAALQRLDYRPLSTGTSHRLPTGKGR